MTYDDYMHKIKNACMYHYLSLSQSKFKRKFNSIFKKCMYVYLPVSHREPVNFSGHAHPKDGKSASLKQIPPFKQGFDIHGSKIIINEIDLHLWPLD